MDGTILHFDLVEKKGLIRGNDDTRYSFELSQWKSEGLPTRGTMVDFEANGENAISIYSMMEQSKTESWLALLFYDFKVHNIVGLIICALYLFALTTTHNSYNITDFSLLENIWGKLAGLAVVTIFLSLLFGMKKNTAYSAFTTLVIMIIASLSSIYSELNKIQPATLLLPAYKELILKDFYDVVVGYAFWSTVLALIVWRAKVADKFK